MCLPTAQVRRGGASSDTEMDYDVVVDSTNDESQEDYVNIPSPATLPSNTNGGKSPRMPPKLPAKFGAAKPPKTAEKLAPKPKQRSVETANPRKPQPATAKNTTTPAKPAKPKAASRPDVIGGFQTGGANPFGVKLKKHNAAATTADNVKSRNQAALNSALAQRIAQFNK